MKKISYLDGLRGLAALQVVFHHFIVAFYPALFSAGDILTHLPKGVEAWVAGSFLNLIWDGNFSVCIFFVLSGFVLSYKFFIHKEEEIIVASSVKRYFRLALPVAFSILSIFFLMKFSLFFNQVAGNITGSDWLANFWKFEPNFWEAMNQAFLGTFFGNTFEYNAILWTIAYEFSGSFLVFGFLAIFGKAKKRWWAYVFLVIIFSQTYYLAFLLGMFLSDMQAHKKIILRKFDRLKIWRVVCLALGLFLASYPIGVEPNTTRYAFMNFVWLNDSAVFYHIWGAFFLMMVLLNSRKMQKLFSFRGFLFLGEISFMMYLTHFFILGSFSSFIFLQLQSKMSYASASISTFAISLPVIFGVAYLTYHLVDKKAVNFSHWVYKKFSKLD